MKTVHQILENKFINIDQSDIDSVVATLKQKQLSGMATIVEEYENALATKFNVKHALSVSSGTAALHLLMYLYDVKPGDEVIVPPTAPIMSVLPIIAVGAVPIFADVNEGDFGYDTDDLENKITSRTKAIVSVPMWGYPVPLTDTISVAEKHNIPLVEDASHCHGSTTGGKLVGTSGIVSFFSTQERKLIATGEGGFFLTNDQYTADRIREIRDFGKPIRQTQQLIGHAGQYGYLFGLNFRITALSAALGISQLKKLSGKIKARTANAADFRDELKSLGWLQELGITPDSTPNYYSMVFFVNHPTRSAYGIAKGLFEQDIVSDTYRFGIKPLYELPILAAYKSYCPNAEQILQQIITLPTHEGLANEDMQRIVRSLNDMS